MTLEASNPTTEDVRAFAEKLDRFAQTLSPTEQTLWERIMGAALGQDAEVQGYGYNTYDFVASFTQLFDNSAGGLTNQDKLDNTQIQEQMSEYGSDTTTTSLFHP